MAKRKPASSEPALRKSFIYMGGVALGVALLGFLLTTFVLGGDGGGSSEEATILSTADGPAISGIEGSGRGPAGPGGSDELIEGGRDPFSPAIDTTPDSGTSAAADTDAAPPAPIAPTAPNAGAEQPNVLFPSPRSPVEVTVLAAYRDSVDIKVSDDVYEGVHAGDEFTPRFNLDEVEGSCVYMKDMERGPVGHRDRFKLCVGDSVQR